ncbi:MAG: sugar ABC transporter substrate-binding protein [Nostocoides sp.]
MARKPAKVAFVYATTTLNPMQEMAYGSKVAADASGAKLTLSAPSGVDGPAEMQLFQSASRTSTDGIAYQTLTPDLFVRPLKTTKESGVPLVAVDTPPPAGSGVDLYVGSSDVEIGMALAKKFLEKIPVGATGEVVIGNAIPGLVILDLRAKGITEAFAKERPGLKVLAPFNSQAEPTANYNAWSAAVKAHPNAVAYLGTGAQDAVSLATIQSKSNLNLLAGGVDLDPAALQGLKDGKIFAIVSPEHWLKGYVAMALLIQAVSSGKPLPTGWFDTGFLTVDSNNVDAITARQVDEKSRSTWFAPHVQDLLDNQATHLRPMSGLG